MKARVRIPVPTEQAGHWVHIYNPSTKKACWGWLDFSIAEKLWASGLKRERERETLPQRHRVIKEDIFWSLQHVQLIICACTHTRTINKSLKSWAWWRTPLTPALGKQRQAGRFLSSRPVWSSKWVPEQPGLHRETLSGKTNQTNKNNKKKSLK